MKYIILLRGINISGKNRTCYTKCLAKGIDKC